MPAGTCPTCGPPKFPRLDRPSGCHCYEYKLVATKTFKGPLFWIQTSLLKNKDIPPGTGQVGIVLN